MNFSTGFGTFAPKTTFYTPKIANCAKMILPSVFSDIIEQKKDI